MQFIDRSKVLYGGAALLGVLTVVYFGFEYLANLSPFTISFVLFSLFTGLLLVGLNRQGNGESLSYILSLGSYLTGLSYTISTFNFSSNQTLISLISSTLVFVVIAYLVTDRELEVTNDGLKKALVVLVIALAVVSVYDVLSKDITYDYELAEEVELQEGVTVGTYTVEKNDVLPRETDSESLSFCIYNEQREEVTRTSDYFSPEMLGFGQQTKKEDIEINTRLDRLEGLEQGKTLEVRSVEDRCPEKADKGIILEENHDGTEVPVRE